MLTTHSGLTESRERADAGAPTPDAPAIEAHVGQLEELMPSVYDELRRLAAAYLRGERVDHTLQGTALVHEAYLRLRAQADIDWQNPGHVIGIFARVMRQTLTNHAIARHRLKRGGEDKLHMTLEFYESRKVDLKALDESLSELEAIDPRQAQIVELRFFAGLTIDEIAEHLSISPATVKREWTMAKIWLRRELSGSA